jgi:hypothetical protein
MTSTRYCIIQYRFKMLRGHLWLGVGIAGYVQIPNKKSSTINWNFRFDLMQGALFEGKKNL